MTTVWAMSRVDVNYPAAAVVAGAATAVISLCTSLARQFTAASTVALPHDSQPTPLKIRVRFTANLRPAGAGRTFVKTTQDLPERTDITV